MNLRSEQIAGSSTSTFADEKETMEANNKVFKNLLTNLKRITKSTEKAKKYSELEKDPKFLNLINTFLPIQVFEIFEMTISDYTQTAKAGPVTKLIWENSEKLQIHVTGLKNAEALQFFSKVVLSRNTNLIKLMKNLLKEELKSYIEILISDLNKALVSVKEKSDMKQKILEEKNLEELKLKLKHLEEYISNISKLIKKVKRSLLTKCLIELGIDKNFLENTIKLQDSDSLINKNILREAVPLCEKPKRAGRPTTQAKKQRTQKQSDKVSLNQQSELESLSPMSEMKNKVEKFTNALRSKNEEAVSIYEDQAFKNYIADLPIEQVEEIFKLTLVYCYYLGIKKGSGIVNSFFDTNEKLQKHISKLQNIDALNFFEKVLTSRDTEITEKTWLLLKDQIISYLQSDPSEKNKFINRLLNSFIQQSYIATYLAGVGDKETLKNLNEKIKNNPRRQAILAEAIEILQSKKLVSELNQRTSISEFELEEGLLALQACWSEFGDQPDGLEYQPDVITFGYQPDAGELEYQSNVNMLGYQPHAGELEYQPDVNMFGYQSDASKFEPERDVVDLLEDVISETDPIYSRSSKKRSLDLDTNQENGNKARRTSTDNYVSTAIVLRQLNSSDQELEIKTENLKTALNNKDKKEAEVLWESKALQDYVGKSEHGVSIFISAAQCGYSNIFTTLWGNTSLREKIEDELQKRNLEKKM